MLMSFDRPGLAWWSQRRGVMPLVMLMILPGEMRSKSAKMVSFMSSVWIRDTPLTVWLPTMARCAIRTRRPPVSSMSDMRLTSSASPGKRCRTSSRKRWLIS